jgi:hypothetical protein
MLVKVDAMRVPAVSDMHHRRQSGCAMLTHPL